MPRRARTISRFALSAANAAADLLTICGTALLIEAAYYHFDVGGLMPMAESRSLNMSGVVALVVVGANLLREGYGIESCLNLKPQIQRNATLWLMAWAAVLIVGFVTKSTHDFSRIVALVFFVTGFPALMAVRAGMHGLTRSRLGAGSASVSRVHLVGYEEDIARFYAGNETESLGLRVVGTSYLRRVEAGMEPAARRAQLAEDLDLAVSVVRFLRPDDVFVLVPWADAADVERCIDAFLRVPAALHLRPGGMLDRFPDLQVARVGRLSGINIGRRPLNLGEIALKRGLDLVLAGLGLALLLPALLVVALLIKLDSPGPVLFRQKRYGFNQQPFGVYKFRSMRVQQEGAFRQASRGDARITRVGRILRRTNVDELPQLLNVLIGDMSLVGPRPHALAHDRSFDRRIAHYARRHNVKPGITGWAQVNGLRGETLTDLDMERRVAHDLHYIDNWSIWFDIQILVQTVFSPRAYRNAF